MPAAPQAPRSDMPGCPDGVPNTRIWTAHVLTGIQPSAAQIGGDVRLDDPPRANTLSDALLSCHHRPGACESMLPADSARPETGSSRAR